MNKQAIISLRGIQTNVENQTSTIELMSEASFYSKDGVFYLVYKETEVTGMDGTTTTIKISENTVNLIRFGAISSNMFFEEGKMHKCNYGTIYGSLEITIEAKKVKINIDEYGGELYVDYEIEIEGRKVGRNDFSIKILKVKEIID